MPVNRNRGIEAKLTITLMTWTAFKDFGQMRTRALPKIVIMQTTKTFGMKRMITAA